MKTNRKLARNNIVKCYVNDMEMHKLSEQRIQLGITMSDLMRGRLLDSNLLNINPSKLLKLLNEIGLDISSINTQLKKYFEDLKAQQERDSACPIEGIVESYIHQQHRLELQIQKLLIRIERRA